MAFSALCCFVHNSLGALSSFSYLSEVQQRLDIVSCKRININGDVCPFRR